MNPRDIDPTPSENGLEATVFMCKISSHFFVSGDFIVFVMPRGVILYLDIRTKRIVKRLQFSETSIVMAATTTPDSRYLIWCAPSIEDDRYTLIQVIDIHSGELVAITRLLIGNKRVNFLSCANGKLLALTKNKVN